MRTLVELVFAITIRARTAWTSVGSAVDSVIEWSGSKYFVRDNSPTGTPPSPPIGGNLFPTLADFGQLPVYGASERRSSPNLHAILAQLEDGTIAKFGRRLTARQQIKSSRWVRIFWTGESFDLMEDGPLLTLDPGVDWIELSGTIVILDTIGFHAAFRSVPELRAAVAGHVRSISDVIDIKNLDGLVERCQRMPSMASKLDSVVQQGLFRKPIRELKAYSSAFPGLGVEWDGDSLIFSEDLEKQWAILRLLDEAGFTGELSGQQFEAPAKREL